MSDPLSGERDSASAPATMRARIKNSLKSDGVRYLLVGIYNTLVGISLYLIFFGWLEHRLHYLFALCLTFVLGTFNGFVAHKLFVFRVRGDTLGQYLRYNTIHLASAGFNFVSLPLLVESLSIRPFYAQALIMFVVTIASFFLHQRFSFKVPTQNDPVP